MSDDTKLLPPPPPLSADDKPPTSLLSGARAFSREPPTAGSYLTAIKAQLCALASTLSEEDRHGLFLAVGEYITGFEIGVSMHQRGSGGEPSPPDDDKIIEFPQHRQKPTLN